MAGAIVKKNLYADEQNLTNQGDNIDLNRLTMDRSFMSMNFTASVVSILEGSLIEANGSMYAVEGGNIDLVMTGNFYVGFDGTAFTKHTTKGTFSSTKGGWYQAGNVIRTLRWRIDLVTARIYIEPELDSSYEAYSAVQGGLYTDNSILAGESIKAKSLLSSQGTSVGTEITFPNQVSGSDATIRTVPNIAADDINLDLSFAGSGYYRITLVGEALFTPGAVPPAPAPGGYPYIRFKNTSGAAIFYYDKDATLYAGNYFITPSFSDAAAGGGGYIYVKAEATFLISAGAPTIFRINWVRNEPTSVFQMRNRTMYIEPISNS